MPKPREPLRVRLDPAGPYVILATEAADRDFADAIHKSAQLASGCNLFEVLTGRPESLLEQLKTIQPKYALVVIRPEELDVNFAWNWLGITTRIDDDPLVDVSSGFVTGATLDAASSFVDRLAKLACGECCLCCSPGPASCC